MSKSPEKRRFETHELNLLFQHPWFTGCESSKSTHKAGNFRLSGSEYWVPVVALMTGCRAGELGGLMLNDVRISHQYPHIIIRPNEYRGVKTKSAMRNVPILDALLELGFADYVARQHAAGVDRLFPDWEPAKVRAAAGKDDRAWSNAAIIRAFNRTVIKAQLGETLAAGARQELTFHSLRGAFKAMLGGAEYRLHPNFINEIVGHEKPDLDRRYVGAISIEDTYTATNKCSFKGLVIPKAL